LKLYTQKIKLGDYSNISFYTALEAFYSMGFEIIYQGEQEDLKVEEDHVFLGGISFIHHALQQLNCIIPEPLDYPISLHPFLGRQIWESTINEIANQPDHWNVFVKPKGLAKKFTGRLVRNTNDLMGCGDTSMNTPVWVSEPRQFVAEWRVFIRYGRVIGVKMYRGDWKAQYNPSIIEKAISAFKEAPNGYALDFGLTVDGNFLLVEANDGYSLGNYGLFYIDYAKLLSARWSQLTKQKDLCNF
jgi:hypothetical protein